MGGETLTPPGYKCHLLPDTLVTNESSSGGRRDDFSFLFLVHVTRWPKPSNGNYTTFSGPACQSVAEWADPQHRAKLMLLEYWKKAK